jgi:transglutaminase-like putative cysteine protease
VFASLRRRLQFCLALQIWICCAITASGAAVPEWLDAARHVELGEFGKGTPGVIVESRIDFSVDASGRFIEKEHVAIRVLNRRAAEPYLHVVGYEDSNQSVVSLQAWSIGPDGRVETTDKKDIATRASFEDFVLYSDSRVKSAAIPSVQDGSLVGYEIIRQGKNVIQGRRFALEENIPVWLSEVRFIVSSGSLRYFLNFPDRVEVFNESPLSVSFRVMRRSGISVESNMPPYWSVRAAVFVNYDPTSSNAVGSWADAGRSISTLYSGSWQSTPEIAAEADRMTATISDSVAKMKVLNDFVSRKVRYVAVEIGEGGYRPHSAGEVFVNRYGDCKDKAVLLISMLDRIGVRAYPALIGTRGDIEADPEIPGLNSIT